MPFQERAGETDKLIGGDRVRGSVQLSQHLDIADQMPQRLRQCLGIERDMLTDVCRPLFGLPAFGQPIEAETDGQTQNQEPAFGPTDLPDATMPRGVPVLVCICLLYTSRRG